MSKEIENIRAAYQEVQEKLKGGQKKLDKDGDGDIDGSDFAMMRKKNKKTDEDTSASADVKPQNYHDADGRVKTRMVHTKRRKRSKDEGEVEMNPKLDKGSKNASEQKESTDESYTDVPKVGTSVMQKRKNAAHDKITKRAKARAAANVLKKMQGKEVRKESSEVSESTYGAMKDAEAHAKKDGKNYKDVSVQHKYDAYHMKKRGYTHFETGSYGTRKYHKGDVAGATKITSDHHSGVSESLTIREKLLSVLSENDRAKHYKGATKPETMDDKLKGKGAKDMMNQPKEVDDTETKGHDDASKAGRVTKPAKQRNGGDQVRSGDQKVVNPIKKMKEAYQSMHESAAAASYHKKMADHHSKNALAHEHEATNSSGQAMEDHDYASNDHHNAGNAHKAAHEALKKHGHSSAEYKKAHDKANSESETAHESSGETPKKWKTAGKSTTASIQNHTKNMKEDSENINELSPDKLKQYRKKAAADIQKRDGKKDIAVAKFKRDHPHMDVDTTDHDAKTQMRKGYRKLAKGKMMGKE